MRYIKEIVLIFALVVFLGFSLTAKDIRVVVSTSWVGAISKAAGAKDVTILAPMELRHPPEYDYKPHDIVKVLEADYIIWAGYEPFVKKMVEATPSLEEKLIQVRTTNTPEYLIPETQKLAEVFGTMDEQERWEKTYVGEMTKFLDSANAKDVRNIKVVASIHQREFLEWLGYKPIKTLGADQLSPADVVEVLKIDPSLIVDNYNSEDGKVFKDHPAYIMLLNFPTKEYPELLDIIRENARRLKL